MKKAVSIPSLKKKADIVFAEYIRKRDAGQPCISCGQFKDNMQCGQFYAKKGYDGLRYDPFNSSAECASCNCFDESHLIGYADNLIVKIGRIEYELLKMRASDYKRNGHKWTRFELEELIKEYKDKLKQL